MMFSRMRRMIAPAGRGSVLVIASLLIGSAAVRIVTSANVAFAQDNQLPTAPMPTANQPVEVTKDETESTSETEKKPANHITSNRSELANLVSAISEREARVIEQEKQLEMRMRALSVADSEIEKRLQSLTEAEAALRATLSLADDASEKDLLRLTAVYESMKPKDAAALFEEMEPNFAAGFLGRMRPDAAAQVLAGLSPTAAYSISVILAGRNANVPKT